MCCNEVGVPSQMVYKLMVHLVVMPHESIILPIKIRSTTARAPGFPMRIPDIHCVLDFSKQCA